jgi:hypothetical protein
MSSVVRSRTHRRSLLKSGSMAAGPCGATIGYPLAAPIDAGRREQVFEAARRWLPTGGRVFVTPTEIRVEGIRSSHVPLVRTALSRALRYPSLA